MPRKKNSDVITGIPKDPEKDLIVQKSRPLFALWQSDLALSDFKILDMYLSRIDSHDPEHRTIVLGKGELEKALGITQIKKNDLHARLKRLYSPIDLTPNDENSLDLVSLFERAKAEKDEYGLWNIRLTCTESAMKYIFNVEKLGYFRYKLRTVTNITSRYTYILFSYLEVNRDFKDEWTVDLSELKRILHCENDASYKAFKVFNDRILKKCHKDLTEKTECRFSYEPIKKGRTVVAVKFKLEPLPKESQQLPGQQEIPLDPDPNNGKVIDLDSMTDEEYDEYFEIYGNRQPSEFNPDGTLADPRVRSFKSKHLGWLAMACDYEFPESDMKIFHDKMMQRGILNDNDQMDYLRNKFNYLNFRATRTQIDDRASYLTTVLENNYG